MRKQRNKRRTETIRLKNRNKKSKRRRIKWNQYKRLVEAVFPSSDSYYVEDTTWNRAPYFYQAPDLSSENPEEDYAKGMHIVNHRIGEWYFDGKKLLLKAANAGHARAQFMLGHFNLEGWDWFEEPDWNLAEVWLTEAMRNGLSGEDLATAQEDLEKLRDQRERDWKWQRAQKDRPKYFKCFGRIYKRL